MSMDALDLLTARMFDYAGMFPPASLALTEALAEAARAPRLARPRILGTDIVVASPDLKNVTAKALESAGFGDTMCAVALVGIEEKDAKRTVRRFEQFNDSREGVAQVVSLELRGKKFASAKLHEVQQALGPVRLYVEPDISDAAWAGSGMALAGLLARLQDAGITVGLKVRGSGRTAITSRSLAMLIPELARSNVPLKATAGIHHPVIEDAYGNRLGFVNIAAALRLHQVLGDAFGVPQIQACLEETMPDAFSFQGELAWRGHTITEMELGEAMDRVPLAVGSCSLREPDEDLARLFGMPAG